MDYDGGLPCRGRFEKAIPSAVHRDEESRNSDANAVQRSRLTGLFAITAAIVDVVRAQKPGDERGYQHFSQRAPDHEARRVLVRKDITLG